MDHGDNGHQKGLTEHFRAMTVGDLKDRYVPKITDDDIRQVERVIAHAQETSPPNAARFVNDMRRVLDAMGLELPVNRGRTKATITIKNGFIGLAISGVGSAGFLNNDITVVRRGPLNFGQMRGKREIPAASDNGAEPG